MNMQSYQDFLEEILIPEDKLQARIQELGKQISQDYQGQDLHMICILRGGVMFLTDLMRTIDVPLSIDFMAISSYGVGARKSSGQIRLTMDLRDPINDRNVLLVEDIVDSGHTLSSVLGLLGTRKPASLKVCTLLDKAERRETEVPIDYAGFVIPNKYVFGYGLDLDEFYRELPFIGVVDEDKYTPPDH
jgi:hypoxanthine phosphoribosyltransferase